MLEQLRTRLACPDALPQLAADLARHLASATEETAFDLLEFPAHREDVAPIKSRATLQQALDVINENGLDTLYVVSSSGTKQAGIAGIITRQAIEAHYH